MFIYFATETDKDFSTEEENVIKNVIKEWYPEDTVDIDDKVDTVFDRALDLYNKDNTLIRFQYTIENTRTLIIQKNYYNEENSNKKIEKINKQLSFILDDLVAIARADNKIVEEEYKLVEEIKNLWNIDIKLFKDSEIPINNTDFNEGDKESKNKDNKDKIIEFIEDYPGDLYCENEHWWRKSRPLSYFKFPNVFDDEYSIDDLFRKFTKDEVDMIVDKIKETGHLIYLPFVKNILSKKFDLRGVKNPFWFIPFCCYGNDTAGILYYEQNGINENRKKE